MAKIFRFKDETLFWMLVGLLYVTIMVLIVWGFVEIFYWCRLLKSQSYFEGAVEISKPAHMTDEQCISAWAKFGFDTDNFPYYLTAWKPNKGDLDALNRGEPVYVKTLSKQLPPMALFTLDENNQPNWE